MMHGNNNNRNNNNRRFSKNNNRNNNNRRFGGGGSSQHTEDEQISPQQRRNFENKRDQHLTKAKEYLSAGERIEAEIHFQYADHYQRMSVLGLDKIAQENQRNMHRQRLEQNNNEAPQVQAQPEQAEPAAEVEIPEIPVDMMGSFPSENNAQKPERRQHPRNNRGRDRNLKPAEPKVQEAAAEPNDLGALPFMQIQLKDAPEV